MDIVALSMLVPILLAVLAALYKVVKFFMTDTANYEYKIMANEHGEPVETVISKGEK